MNSQTAKVNILVADDHTLFRKGMVFMLKSFKEVGTVDDAANGKDAIRKIKEGNYDLVLLDLDMPVQNGRETAKKLVVIYPSIKIIMVSMHDSLDSISDLIEIGVHSYLLKNSQPDEVRTAINLVINNEFYYNNLVSKALHRKVQENGLIKSDVVKRSGLSPREIQVLKLICQEYTMREISEMLCLSEQTVQTHRKNLMKKINAKNTVSLVKFAFQNGIVGF